jgi:hypothetical protein
MTRIEIRKKASVIIYDSKTSDDKDNHSDDKIYKSLIKEVKKYKQKNNYL